MFFGAFSISAVKLVLGLPWDSEILDRMYWQLGEMASNQSYTYPIGVHFDQYDPRKCDMIDMIMWPMDNDQVVVAMVTR